MLSLTGQVIIIFAAGVLGLVIWARGEAVERGTKTKEELVGICRSAIETASAKENRKQKILDELGQKSELSNSDIREMLGVASRTAVRYLDELEAEGKVEQVGKIGHAVVYRLK